MHLSKKKKIKKNRVNRKKKVYARHSRLISRLSFEPELLDRIRTQSDFFVDTGVNNEIEAVRTIEPYIELPGRDSRPATPVPEGYYYVLGGNRSNSQDSRSRGPLDGDNIVGKAWFTYWPPDRWGIVPHEDYEGVP